MATLKFVTYHQEWCGPKKFAVFKEHENGALDIGPVGAKAATVTDCELTSEPRAGACTAFAEEKPKKEKDEPK